MNFLCNILPLLIGLTSLLIGWWAANRMLKPRVQQLEETLEGKNQAYSKLSTDHGALHLQHNVLQTDHAHLQTDLKDWQGKHSTVLGQYNGLALEHKTLTTNFNTLSDTHAALIQKHTVLTNDFMALSTLHKTVVSDFEDHKTKSAVEITGLKSSVADWTSKYTSVTTELHHSQAEGKILEGKLVDANTQIGQVQTELVATQRESSAKIQESSSGMTELAERNTQLVTAHQQLIAERNKLSHQLITWSSERSQLKHRETEIVHAYEVLNAKRHEIQHEYEALQAVDANHKAQLVQLQTEVQSVREELNTKTLAWSTRENSKEGELAEAQNNFNVLLGRYHHLEEKHKNLSEDLEEAGENAKAFQDENRKYIVQIRQMEKAHQDHHSEWERKYHHIQHRHDQLELAFKHRTQRLEKMNMQLAEVFEEMEEEHYRMTSSYELQLAECRKPKATKPDDLKVVEGIGLKIEGLLNAAGIWTYKELAATSTSVLQEILNNAGKRYQMHNPSTWARQSAMAGDGEWAQLDEYKKYLDGGVDPDDKA